MVQAIALISPIILALIGIAIFSAKPTKKNCKY